MMRRFACSALLWPSLAAAQAPQLRHQADLHGNVVVVGAPLAFDCGAGFSAPAGATASCASQTNTADGAPDLYWRDNLANASILPTDARTSATLSLPAGALVTYARLYWAALLDGSTPDPDASIDWLGGPTQQVVADDSWLVPHPSAAHPTWNFYQATSDVTDFVRTWGAGDFRVSDVDGLALASVDSDLAFSAWTLVVFYERPGDDLRTVALFDGFTPIDPGVAGQQSTAVTVDGFLVPGSFAGHATTFGYEGDLLWDGDAFRVNGTALTDALNPASNAFNGSRSYLGAPVSGLWDVPQLGGQAGEMAGYDLDTFDISPLLAPGDDSAALGVDSSFDTFFLGGLIASMDTYAPRFSVEESVVDLDGGDLLTGDLLEITVTATQDGSDTAVDVVLVNDLDNGMALVPGSLEIVAGGNDGPQTDTSGDDQAELDGTGPRVVFRLGTGGTASVGGSVASAGTVAARFQVEVTAGAGATLENQAVLSASGQAGAAMQSWLADADPAVRGAQPTVLTVDSAGTGSGTGTGAGTGTGTGAATGTGAGTGTGTGSGTATGTGTSTGTTDTGPGGTRRDKEGCSCATGNPLALPAGWIALGLLAWRRRR